MVANVSHDPTAILLKLGVQVATRVVPKGAQWLQAKFFWNDVVIVGQPRAGKTSFANYLRLGVFATTRTARTTKTTTSSSFVVPIGRDRSLLMKVRGATDTVGQLLASEHAELCRKRKPQIIVVVLDLESNWKGTTEYSAEFYLSEFFSHLLTQYNRSKSMRKKLRKVIVLLNKKDVVSAKKAAAWTTNVKLFFGRNVSSSAADLHKLVAVLECSLVESYDSGRLPATALQEMALSLE